MFNYFVIQRFLEARSDRFEYQFLLILNVYRIWLNRIFYTEALKNRIADGG
jgi:hypothetical protein